MDGEGQSTKMLLGENSLAMFTVFCFLFVVMVTKIYASIKTQYCTAEKWILLYVNVKNDKRF